MKAFIEVSINLFLLYLLLGLLFAFVFAWKGAGTLDIKATCTSWFFKLLILPGAMVLWPLLLSKWISQNKRQ